MTSPARFYPDAQSFLKAHPRGSGKLCFTNGCFDLIHPGHVRYSPTQGLWGTSWWWASTPTPPWPSSEGSSRPLQDETARALVLLGLRSVDAVVLFDEETPLNLITALQPDVLVKGGDYTPETVVGRDVVEARGGRLVLIPFLPGHSTTTIVNRIKTGRGVLA